MHDLVARLRAALTPQILLAFAAAMLLLWGVCADKGEQSSALERRTARVLSSIAGAGEVEVVIRMQEDAGASALSADKGEAFPCGAVAVAQGADDPIVRLELQEALCALLSLPASSGSIVTGGHR